MPELGATSTRFEVLPFDSAAAEHHGDLPGRTRVGWHTDRFDGRYSAAITRRGTERVFATTPTSRTSPGPTWPPPRSANETQNADLVLDVGTRIGHSVREVLETVGRVTAGMEKPEVAERRPGDPAELVADTGLILETLNWAPRYGLDDMVESAWTAWTR